MREMIDAYLAFAKGEGEEKTKKIELKSFMDKILKKNVYDNEIIIRNSINTKAYLFIRPLAMNRVLLNILSNAIQHTNKKILISSSLSSSEKIIIIEDDGPGIPENKRLEVFKAFHRLDKSRFSKYGRTGLGLTIAKNIVKGHGGNIKLYKSKIGGLKVRISLPI